MHGESFMMIRDTKEKQLLSKQEATFNDNKSLVSSRSWAGLKDPRIVRVSRLFGGKDRHSKVSTVRGLRDRRVRLSVPTAIQLYDLQDRLGLNQPSKVVDWLLKAAQHEIDKLPPLQMPPVSFMHFPRSSKLPREAPKDSENVCGNRPPSISLSSRKSSDELGDLATLPKSTLWSSKQSEAAKEIQKPSMIQGNEVENQVSSNGQFPRLIHPSLSGMLHNAMPYTSFYHFDPSTALDSNSSREEVEHAHHPSPIISSPYLVPPLLPSYAISQNEYFQMSNSTSENTPSYSLRSSPQSGTSTMRYFHSNIVPKH